jgi:BioD-like phosphotransacetylase family protein
VATPAKYLLIGSTEVYSGKSGTILGIAHQLQGKGLSIAYVKLIGTDLGESNPDRGERDVSFIAQTLDLSESQVRSPLLYLDRETIDRRLQGEDTTNYLQACQSYLEDVRGDLIILEGPGNLSEGSLFGLSLAQIAGGIDASILLVARYHSPLVVDSLLKAKQELGERLLGVVINDIPVDELERVAGGVKPFLEGQEIGVLGLLPRSSLLRSVSVREIARQLGAEILCRRDRLDLMVENLTIGAMNVNSALEYFRQAGNKAVVTGGDRTDLQLAALETSTNCLILTGHIPPQPLILSRAEDLEIPILSVDLDTLATVEIVDQTFGKVPIQEDIKVQCLQELMAKDFAFDSFMDKLIIDN